MITDNLKVILNIADKNNVSFILEELKNDLISLEDEKISIKDKITKIGILSEKILKRIILLNTSSNHENRFKNIGDLIFELTKLSKTKEVYFPKEVEQLFRMIAFYRNLCVHELTLDFESEIPRCNELTESDFNVLVRHMYKILIYLIKMEDYSGIKIPFFKNNDTSKTLVYQKNNQDSIPRLDYNLDKYPEIDLNNYTDTHDISIIIEYLLKQRAYEDIEEMYFNYSENGKIVHKILRNRYGINRKWQLYFRDNNPKQIVDELSDEKHKTIILAIKSYYKNL